MHDLTHEQSSFDWFGEFQSLIKMPLSMVKEFTDIFISRGYIKAPRSLKFCEEFRECAELLVLSALYCLGNGNLFRQCRSMCNISVSEIQLFFFRFLGVMIDMKDMFFTLQRCEVASDEQVL
jgi:hypothetical protein